MFVKCNITNGLLCDKKSVSLSSRRACLTKSLHPFQYIFKYIILFCLYTVTHTFSDI